MFDENGNFIGYDTSSYISAAPATYSGDLYPNGDGTYSQTASAADSYLAGANSTSTTSVDPAALTGLAAIGNSAANIIKAVSGNPSAGYYNAAGQFVPITGSTAPTGSATSIGNAISTATGSLTQLLPLILIGGGLLLVVKLFSKK